jgi:hypothetical protein
MALRRADTMMSAGASVYNGRESGLEARRGASVAPSLLGETSLGPVERLLVGLCRRDAGAEVGAADLAQLASKSFRNGLSVLASRHRVAGLVLVALQSHPSWSQIPPAVAQGLLCPEAAGEGGAPADRTQSFAALLSRAHSKQEELERLLGLLRSEQLAPLVLKGPALCRGVYRHPVERRYGDFDLLFPVEQVDRAIEVMSAAGYTFPFSPEKRIGYRQLHFHLLLRRQGLFRAEVHWGLSKTTSPFQLDPEAFLSRAVTTRMQETPMRIPCPEHLLLHLAHENLRDSFSRFGRIVDLDRILASAPGLDWDYTLAQARQGGLQSLLGLCLELARGLLATAVPPDVLASLRPGAATRIHLRLLRPTPSLMRRRLREVGAASSLQFWLAAGWRRRWPFLFRMLSGRQSARDWIFRESSSGPPTAREALVTGLKSGFRLASHHATLYRNRLFERADV